VIRFFFRENLSKTACQGPKRPNSMTCNEIEMADELWFRWYT